MPICCIVAAYEKKYFNTSLTYCLITSVAKIVQIVTLIVAGHIGTCILPITTRLTIILFCTVELCCLSISTWILKNIKRVDRESKAVTIIKKKSFLAD
jgi:uncharacterized Tic20 family protein